MERNSIKLYFSKYARAIPRLYKASCCQTRCWNNAQEGTSIQYQPALPTAVTKCRTERRPQGWRGLTGSDSSTPLALELFSTTRGEKTSPLGRPTPRWADLALFPQEPRDPPFPLQETEHPGLPVNQCRGQDDSDSCGMMLLIPRQRAQLTGSLEMYKPSWLFVFI